MHNMLLCGFSAVLVLLCTSCKEHSGNELNHIKLINVRLSIYFKQVYEIYHKHYKYINII